MNCGFLWSNKAKWYLFHDVDLIMKKKFIENCFKSIQIQNSIYIQPYSNRCVIYINETKSKEIYENINQIENLKVNNIDVKFPNEKNSLGGSLMIQHDIYKKIGGHDPFLFWGWAPEDQFIIKKLKLYQDIHYCDEPYNDLFHLYHENVSNNNDKLYLMLLINSAFEKLSIKYKKKLIDIFSKSFNIY